MRLSLLFLAICGLQAGYAAQWVVDGSSRDSDSSATGAPDHPFLTIGAAAERAQPGDVVLVRDGIYRERVSPPRSGTSQAPIIYRAEHEHLAIIRGSEVWTPSWRPFGSSGVVLFAPWEPSIFPAGQGNSFLQQYNENWKNGSASPARPQAAGPFPLTLGQVYVNGASLRQAASVGDLERSPASWMTSPDGTGLLVHFSSPDVRTVEVTVRNRIFAPFERGLHDIVVEGFCFEHCANQLPAPENGAVSTRSGRRWVIRNNIIRHAGTIGLDFGSEGWGITAVEGERPGATRIIPSGDHLIEGNIVEYNGLCGMCAWKLSNSIVRRNVVEHNNCLGFSPAAGVLVWSMAGIKLLNTSHVTVEDNLVRDNESYGIWFDNGYRDCRITRNVVQDNCRAGIFIELGMPVAPGEIPDTVLIDNNVVAGTRIGDGIYAHDASGVTVANNLLAENSCFGIRMRNISDRMAGNRVLTETSEETIRNNILVNNGLGALSFPLPSARSHDIVSDDNLFVDGRGDPDHAQALFYFENMRSAGRLKNITARDIDTLAARYQAAAAAAPDLVWNRVEAWRILPFCTFEQWKRVSAWDAGSVETRAVSFLVRSLTPEVQMRLDGALSLPRCGPVAGVDRDFTGNAMPVANVLPGPFQVPLTNQATFGLWPPAPSDEKEKSAPSR